MKVSVLIVGYNTVGPKTKSHPNFKIRINIFERKRIKSQCKRNKLSKCRDMEAAYRNSPLKDS